MKKRVLAILLVLVMVTGGLFAVAAPDNAIATLTANLGEYLMHGFTNSSNLKYQSTISIDDAFGTTAPSFKYGYKTNSGSAISFNMSVGSFINQTVAGTVKIEKVTSNRSTLGNSATGVYTIFAKGPTGLPVDEAIITVYPAKAPALADHTGDTTHPITAYEFAGDSNGSTGAPAGTYVAEITFSVVVS